MPQDHAPSRLPPPVQPWAAVTRLPIADGWLRVAERPAADGRVAPRGTLLLLTGRCEFLEKYEEQATEWSARGWRVVGFDWRGQGLSSRFLPNRHKGHVPDFELFLDDLDAVLAAHCPAGAPLVVFAHSMGGHVALRHAAERQGGTARRFDALVLSAPMLGIRTGPLPQPAAAAIARMMCIGGRADEYAPGQLDFAEETQRFEGNLLTSDPARFARTLAAIRACPDLALGGVTYGWLDAAYRSLARLWAPGVLERVAVPVLLLSAGADRVVPPERHAKAARRLPRCTLRQYPTALHELMMEHDAIRSDVWADIDGFMDAI
jgi:lysophospholipase